MTFLLLHFPNKKKKVQASVENVSTKRETGLMAPRVPVSRSHYAIEPSILDPRGKKKSFFTLLLL